MLILCISCASIYVFDVLGGVNLYFAIIGDIIGSKQLKNRAEIQNKLKTILNQINLKYADEISANFIVTIGDEFQGLLSRPHVLLDIINEIKIKIYPIRIRIGIGIGNIDTEIDKKMAIGADGPAYHYARKMIDEIRLNEKGKMSDSTNIKIYAEGKTSILNLINSNLCLCSFIESKWTNKQRDLIKEDMLFKQNQRELAKKFNLAQSSVQRRFKSAGYYDYINAQEIINKVMVEEWGVNYTK
jgi:hypothetical protein